MKPELFQTLLRTKSLHIELITSKGHSTPAGQWLVSKKNEWVLLLSGSAKLKFKGGRLARMKKGVHVLIPAGKRHRVEWTKPKVKTVWLAVHFK